MYRVELDGATKGWFTPSVTSFGNNETMAAIRTSLGKVKVGLRDAEYARAQYQVSEAISGSEGDGGLIVGRGIFPAVALLTENELDHFMSTLYTHLTSAIDETGFATVKNKVVEGSAASVDAGRLAFLWLTLTEYEQRLGHDTSAATERLFSFLSRIRPDMSQWERGVVDVYTRFRLNNETSITFSETVTTKNVLFELQKIRACQFFPIETLPDKEKIMQATGHVYACWHSEKDTASFASYADLAPALQDIGEHEKVKEVVEWYREHQQEDGSFGNRPGSNYVYTRGVSKVAESLALVPEAEEMVAKSIAWLRAMQYTRATLYTVSQRKHKQFLGGIRHDYWDQSVWLDSACHALLGAIRYRDAQRSSTPR